MKISSNFDAGSIEIVSADSLEDIQLRIRRDNAAEFAQWFYFRVQGAAYQHCTFRFLNAAECAYRKAGSTTKRWPPTTASTGSASRPATKTA